MADAGAAIPVSLNKLRRAPRNNDRILTIPLTRLAYCSKNHHSFVFNMKLGKKLSNVLLAATNNLSDCLGQ